MIRILYIFILSLLTAGLAGCTSQVKEEKKIQFVVSNWIGYSPLLYAYEKGMLDDMNIELIITNSLQSSLLMFKKNSYEGIASTQRELCIINNKTVDKDVFMPLYIFDRSYGGDAILSNIPKNKLFDEKFEYINIFLEKESINELLFEGLKKLKEWDDTQFKLHNINQYNLAQLDFTLDPAAPNLIITYEPYLTLLKQKGFHLVESTKNDKLLVFDFLSVREGLLSAKEIKKLQGILQSAESELKKNTEAFYDTVKLYFDDLGFEEFKESLEGIKFNTDKDTNKQMIEFMEKENISELLEYLKSE